ncbi:metallophosphoesterase [Neobacillus terrae]|uniref:metallophosphoesterase n=1 Tax=Neobacillus terrae TaxID=3034837 RepID=UPI00140802BB|nr:metallophosphoesterase [Neobacillus terrae]NHM29296.1 metallophosphoesterase [Neobacillus terrae]
MKRELAQNEKTKLSRRSFLKGLSSIFLGAAVSGSSYSFLIERFWIETKTINLSFDRLPSVFSGTKIVQISDLHLGHFYSKKNLSDLVKRVNRLKPDILCFTGDLVEDGIEMLEECTPLLQKFRAPLGKFAIVGNHDFRSGQTSNVIDTLSKSGFNVLINKNAYVKKNGHKIYFAGLDDMMFGVPDIKKSLLGIPKENFTIMLAHEPDFADAVAKYPVDLQLSGHSHGGQIKIPFFGPIFTPDGAVNYFEGLKTIQGSNLRLYTNRGIGTTFLPFRFNCRPEITVFQIDCEQK